MKILIILATTLLSSLAVYSQNNYETPVAPNQEQIRIAVQDKNSEYFYPTLFDKYFNGDTTLNIEQYRHLYYGYVYQDNYRPLETLNYADSITNTLALNTSDSTLSSNIIPKLEYFIDKALEAEPFNMSYINFMIFIKQKHGAFEAAKIYAKRLEMIKKTIFSSGTGLRKESPWHVLYSSDEQDILNSLGVKFSKPILSSAHIEYFHLPIKNNGNKGYYFDISRRYLKAPRGKVPDPRKRFEINPKTNPRSKRYEKIQLY